MTFKDHFSGHAGAYARHRPTYPEALYRFLAAEAPGPQAWDVATGSGQAAAGLAEAGCTVWATDASAEQVAEAVPHPRVRYAVERAEATSLETASVDLVTVAQALHWLDCPAFFAEVERVLRPGGLLAVWTYALCHVTPAVDAVVERYYSEVVGPYWPPERRLVERGYAEVTWPFEPVEAPAFEMTARWTVEALLGYLGTWSATQRCRAATGRDPLERIRADLHAAWGTADERVVVWPLRLYVRRKSA